MSTPPDAVPRLTFAIPFYRGRAYLERAIASVLRQSEAAWQLIVCDDGGLEPGIGDLIRSYGDSRITYHRNERNLGMAGNWNRCLDLAGTDLVNILHADDELLEGYAPLMTRLAAQHPTAVALFCGAQVIGEDGGPCFSFPDFFKRLLVLGRGSSLVLWGQEGLRALLRGNFIMCPTVCYRKSRLGDRRFCEQWRMVQDLELFTRLLLEGETLVGVTAPAYAYRRHTGNATTAYTENLLRFREESQLYDDLAQLAALRGFGRAARVARRKSILKLHLLYHIALDFLRGHLCQAWEKAGLLQQLGTVPGSLVP